MSSSKGKEQERLASLAGLNILDTPPEERYDRITRLVKQLFQCEIVLVSLVDEHRQWFKSHPGLAVRETPRAHSFCAHAIEQDAIYIVEDARENPAFANNPLVTGPPYIRFYAGVPLHAMDGSDVGTLCLIDPIPRSLPPEDQKTLSAFASIVEEQLHQDDVRSKIRQVALREEQAKTALLAMPDMVFIVSKEGIFIGSNERPGTLLKTEKLIHRSLQEVLPTILADNVSTAINQALDAQEQVTFEYRLDSERPTYYEIRIKPVDHSQVVLLIRDISQEVQTEVELTKNRILYKTILHAQSLFIDEGSSDGAYQSLLDDLLALTSSEYGMIGEVQYENQQPYIIARAISNTAEHHSFFDDQLKNANGQLEFRNPNNLLSATLAEEHYLISGSPETDPRRGGLPSGHPRLACYIGIPIRFKGTLCAILALANRPQGYREEDYLFLEPLLNTIGQFMDANRRREAYEWANKQSRLLSEVSRQTSNGIVISDLEGRIEWVNSAFENITGYTVDEVVGKKPGSFLQGPDTNPNTIEFMSSQLKQRAGFDVELINYRSDNTPYWIRLSCSVLKNEQGIPGGFLAIQNDIDSQKRSEFAREDSLRLQDAILETMVDGLVTTNVHGTISLCNSAVEKIFGYAPNWLIGKNIKVLMPKKYAHKHDAYMKDYRVNQPKHSIMGRTRDLTGRRQDGTFFPLEISVSETVDKGESLYVALIRDISDSRDQQIAIERLAYYDPLTNLANRRLLDDRIQQVMSLTSRSESYSAMLIIDLDDFKNINDSLGHRVGDVLLNDLGQRILSCIWHADTAARLGGDEFCILLTSLGTDQLQAMERAKVVSDRVLAQISQPYLIEGQSLKTSASVGITIFKGENTLKDEIMKQADIAMYEAKQAGKSRVCFFNHNMEKRILNRLKLEADLRHAIAEKQLSVHYQPVVNSESLTIGLEALARWNHPEQGWINPEEFIAIAESHQMIIQLGDFVLNKAMEDYVRWKSTAPELKWRVAINISQYQLASDAFLEQVKSALARHDIDPGSLILEVTESTVAESIETSIRMMGNLKELGLTFSLDDFGTGYSSLAYLKQLPISELKIDKSFVDDVPNGEEDVKIVQSILSLAKAMELEVVAEGVETSEQWQFLKAQGCDFFQGYLFSRPLPAREVEALIQNRRHPLGDQ
ncbi:MAG: EAL domain-containing protein [Saccharospirillum sp.]|nr:EAL domain-containing protein [Saccharospirillum sp.]